MKQEREIVDTTISGYEHSVRNHPFFIGGVIATKRNIDIWCRCLVSWLYLIEDLMALQRISFSGRRTRMNNFMQALSSVSDLRDLFLFLDWIADTCIGTSELPVENFKHSLLEASGRIEYRGLLSPISQSLYPFFIEVDPIKKGEYLRVILQFLRFPLKLSFESIGLEEEALAEYIEYEENATTVDTSENAEMLDGISNIIHDWFGSFNIDELLPINGPGSVAEGPLTVRQKYDSMRLDQKLVVLLGHSNGRTTAESYFPVPPKDGLVRCSRTVFVPKTVVKLRTISMEPCTLQYLQQGVMYALYRFIGSHPYLGVRIQLEDQGQNQILALEGSKYHNHGTIDLSKASDSVSWALVRRVFSRTPKLYKWLLGTRSVCTDLPNGDRIALKKYAPMGSALCFPIECILFAAIIEYASRSIGGHYKHLLDRYSVYGDDLVVSTYIYDKVIETLEKCGFQVNRRKSYNLGSYRESCGKEYYYGVDVSSLYYRIPFYRKKVSPAAYGSWCSAANNAAMHHLHEYRRHLIKMILGAFPKKGPFFTQNDEDSPLLWSPNPTNFHLRKFWHKGYQREYCRYVVVSSRPRGEEFGDDDYSYFTKLVMMAKRSNRKSSSDEPSSPYTVQSWISFFSLSTRPAEEIYQVQLDRSHDWWVSR